VAHCRCLLCLVPRHLYVDPAVCSYSYRLSNSNIERVRAILIKVNGMI
jgi:protein-L-isoaspartate O-methyltransferase